MRHFHDSISGYFTFADVYRLAVERAMSPAVFVELGALLGKSTAFMAVEIVNSCKNITFHVVDNWQGGEDVRSLVDFLKEHDGYAMFEENMRRGGVWDRITPHRMDSAAAAALFADGSVDFCFIDADHFYDACLADIRAWLPKMKPGGLIAGDDYDRATFLGVVHAVQDAFGDDVKVMGRSWLHHIPT